MRRIRVQKKGTCIGTIAIVVLMICGVVTYQRIELEKESSKLTQKQQALEEIYEANKEKAEEIERQSVEMDTDKYIEEIARERFGLVYKDEIIFREEEDN